jgi:YD repeat-containing protein
MTIVIGGNDTGLLNGSLTILNRGDQTGNADAGHDESILVNVANGNLVVQHTDAYLPSQGEDSLLVRTYNSRGVASDEMQGNGRRWSFSPFLKLNERSDNDEIYYEIRQGDGSLFLYRLNAETGLWESTDGAGAFETLEDLGKARPGEAAFRLTRSDQTVVEFDKFGRIIRSVDTNGNEMTYEYESAHLVRVIDDTGHTISYHFEIVLGENGEENTNLVLITDETEGTLVEYRYDDNRLIEVIDRMGHSTKYFYTDDGFLNRIVLPEAQDADGDGEVETYATREIRFEYEEINWHSGSESFNTNSGQTKTLTKIIGPDGGITTFDYALILGNVPEPQGPPKGGKKGGTEPADDKFFDGGVTRVVDALGNARAFSNEQQYQDWRAENGFYTLHDAALVEGDAGFAEQLAQAEAIRDAHSLHYTYNQRSILTEVVDQQGFHTTYQYDSQENLIAVTDRNGWGVTHSDSSYYRSLRAELGYTDIGGNGRLVTDLSDTEIADLLEAFTSHFEYDDRGNLLRSTDNEGNATTFTYTSFNKVATSTAAMGHALVSLDDQFYQDKRVELGYAALVANLNTNDIDTLLALYTTTFEYDDPTTQNLIKQVDPGGDITLHEYDAFGNRARTIVLLDPAAEANPDDPLNEDKVQITTFAYDAFGNLVESVNGEGDTTTFVYDHFGNLLRSTDGNGGVTQFTYDDDDRILTILDPEGHLTTNAYDAVGNRIAVTDANGHTVTRVYDLNDRLITIIDLSESISADDRTTAFEYDVVGNNTKITDAEGRETTFNFDTRRQLVEAITAEVAGPDGVTPTQYSNTLSYDGENNLITSTNNRGFTSKILYDQNGLVLQTTDPLGHITRYQHDANLNTVTITAGIQLPVSKRQELTFSFDEEDQEIQRTDAEGNQTASSYDAPGTIRSVTEALGEPEERTTNFEYDKANRLIREILPAVIDPISGLPVRYEIETKYDDNGNAIEVIDERGNSTHFFFNKDDRIVMVEDANNIKTVFTYDSRHNTTNIQVGVEASWDAVDQKVTVTAVDDAQITTNRYDEFNQLIAVVDGIGNALAGSDATLHQGMRLDLGYATLVDDLSDTDKDELRALYTTHFAYDRVGNQTSETDNLGRTTEFEYDALNELVTRTDAKGTNVERMTRFRYDGNGNLVGQTDAKEQITTFAYDALDRLELVTDPLLIQSKNEYDAFGNLTAATEAYGTSEARKTEYVYDLNNRLKLEIDPEQHERSVEYDAVGNRIKVTDARGKETQYFYDALDRNIKIIDARTFETRFEYDGVGNQISLIDARGGVTRFDYDPGNRQIRLEDAEGRVTTFEYDVRGNTITQTTAFGETGPGSKGAEVTRFEYDAENNLRSVTDAKNNTSTTGYDRVYNVTEINDRNGNKTTTSFDALNRAILIEDPELGETKFRYDAVDNVLELEDALGRVTEYRYDDNDRLIRQIDPDLVETHYGYDDVANVRTITRAANTADAAAVSYTYDLDDRLETETDALGNTTTYRYDEEDNLTRVIDPLNHTTQFVYDDVGQVETIIDPEGNRTEFRYDRNGNRTQVIGPSGHFLATSDDASAKAKRVELGFAMNEADLSDNDREQLRGLHATTTYYNSNNEVVLTVDAEGYAVKSDYDANGNVMRETLFQTPLSIPVDRNNEPTPTSDAQEDQVVEFAYDKLNRLVTRTSADGFDEHFVYDAGGNLIERRQALDLAGTEEAVTRFYYDTLDREVARLTPEGHLVRFGYNKVGKRTSKIVYEQRAAVPTPGNQPTPASGDTGRLTTFAYDVNGRLEREVSPTATTEFIYDARGNQRFIVEAVGTDEQRQTEFIYDKADRLTDTMHPDDTITHLVLAPDGNIEERHEAFGTAEVRVTKFFYDGNHNIIREELQGAAGGAVRYFFDAAQNLVEKILAFGTPEARSERFEYDRDNRLVAELNGLNERTEYEYDGADNRTRVLQAAGQLGERDNLYEYDRDNRLVGVTDGNDFETRYEYDGAGNRTASIQFVGDPPVERKTTYEYDLDNRLLKVTSPELAETAYAYDVLGNKIQTIDANGGVTARTFDANGRVLTELTPGNVLRTFEYDALGNLTSRSEAFAPTAPLQTFGAPAATASGSETRTTTIVYDMYGRQTHITDGEGFTTAFTYDNLGRQTKVERGRYLVDSNDTDYVQAKKDREFPLVTQYRYDDARHPNKVTQVIDGENNITRYSYDAFGNRRFETVEFADTTKNQVTEYQYDNANQLTKIISPEGGITEFYYDNAGRQTEIRTLQKAGATAGTDIWVTETFRYDDDDNQTHAIDGKGIVTFREYDEVGNLVSETVAFDRVQRTFDGNGRVLSETPLNDTSDARKTVFEYNLDNHLIAEIDPEDNRTEFGRDARGNRTSVTDALGRKAYYWFDGQNKLIAILDAEKYLNTFTYDSNGNRTEARIWMEKYTGPIDPDTPPTGVASAGDRVVTTHFDLADNIEMLVKADGQTIVYENNGAGIMTRKESISSDGLAPSRVETYQYDGNGRLEVFTDADGTVTTQFYDEANNTVREEISNVSDPNALRATAFEYDKENRLRREISDPISNPFGTDNPNGLNIVQELQYDKIGNVITKIDGNGNVTESTFDLNNQLKAVVVDPTGLNLITRFTYDNAGNQITMIDARQNTANFEYDDNNRLTKEILPAVTVFDIQNGERTSVRPATVTVYDAVGNVVQVIDPNNIKTTQYYNDNNQLVAVLRGDNTLTEFDYNAANELVAERLYMQRLPLSAHNINVRPTQSTGEVRETNREYDLGGRIVRVIHPSMAVTTVDVTTNSSNPTHSTTNFKPQELIVYNGFGEAIETFDRNAIGNQSTTAALDSSSFAEPNNRHINYYDQKGRVVATVNAEGFLTEWDYDAQDNVIQQRQYKVALDMSAVNALTQPDAAVKVSLGTPEIVDSAYDPINRLITQTSAQFDAVTVNESTPSASTTSPTRVTTLFSYDSMGNQTSRTRADSTNLALTEYFYYDAAGRQVGFVNEENVLHQYKYDATGNQTLRKRFFNALTLTDAQLRTADLAALLADVTLNNDKDQATAFAYDEAGREISITDKMDLDTTADDLIRRSSYDAAGNKSKVVDEDGHVRTTGFDGMNRANFAESPDGSGNIVQYDAAGNAELIYTGEVANTLVPASIDTVQLDNVGTSSTSDDVFQLSWSIPGAANVSRTYVVYDSSSHSTIPTNPAQNVEPETTYGNQLDGSTSGATFGVASFASAGFNPGDRVYFRIVSEDSAHNRVWTKEMSFLVPPRFRDVEVSQPADNQLRVSVRFDATPTSPELLISGHSAASLVHQGSGVYAATVNITGNPELLTYQIRWQDGDSNTHLSTVAPFAATDAEVGALTSVSENGSVFFETKIASSEFTHIIAKWRLAGSTSGFANTGQIAPTSSTAGVDVYDTELSTLANGTSYEIVLLGVRDDGTEVLVDTFQITTGSADGTIRQTLSWTLPEVGDDADVGNAQLVVIDGQQVPSSRDAASGRLLVDASLNPNSAADFAVFYGDLTGNTHTVTVDQTIVTTEIDIAGFPFHRVDAYQLDVNATGVPAGTQVAWRPAGSGTEFSNVAAEGAKFTVFSSGNTPREFDLKVFYIDGNGREVIVDWRRVAVNGPNIGTIQTTPGAETTIVNASIESLTVLARETDASVSRGANATNDAFAFTRGLYTGPVSDETVLTVLNMSSSETTGSGNVTGMFDANGLTEGYFVESEFNALNHRIATNEGTGVWRRFGVDANGNAVATFAYGTKAAETGNATPITTYTTFNDRNFETGEYGALVAVDRDADGATNDETSARAITLWARDFQDRIVTTTQKATTHDASGNARDTVTTTVYNALGLVTSELVAGPGTLSSKQMGYDVLGNLVKETDGNSNVRYNIYDGTRLTVEIGELGDRTTHVYDTFGRRIQTTTPPIRTSVSGTTQSAVVGKFYDQRDRLIRVNDGLGNDTLYGYDKRNNRTSVRDTEGNNVTTAFDNMGRAKSVTGKQNNEIVTESREFDIYGNVISETDAMGDRKSFVYGAFARKLRETDEGMRVTTFTYDDFGRLKRQQRGSGATAQDISKTYDTAGRLTRINDTKTGVSTDYTYDVVGNRSHESVTTLLNLHNRDISYSYDGLRRMTGWNDSAQNVNLSYQYDGAGNLRHVSGTGTNHWYHYDANNRQTQKSNSSDPNSTTATKFYTYAYDLAGNRITFTSSGVTVNYAYDLNQRVVHGATSGFTATWQYDKVGNVLQYQTVETKSNGDVTTSTSTYEYYENYRNFKITELVSTFDGSDTTVDERTVTTLTLNKSGRVTQTLLADSSGDDDPSNFTFTHAYTADGREISVTGTGDAKGTSTSAYDVNDNLSSINLGQGDAQANAETKSFVYNNENQIIYRAHETGETADSVGDDATPRLDNTTEFFYANGNPVGQKGNTEESGTVTTVLDEEGYNLVQPIGEDSPDLSVIQYRVLRGDNLQAIADRLYGNPSLWFVIAEANGLNGMESLKEGALLQIPNTLQTGRITDETHVVYDQNEITGTTLPNLATEQDACAIILAVILIILIIIIAVVVAVVTFGAATAISGAIAATGISGVAATLLTVAAVAVVGAAIAFVGSLVTQGLLIAFGVQDDIDWTAVAAESVAGAFAGIGAGLSAALKVAVAAGKLASVSAKVATAVKVVSVGIAAAAGAGGEAIRQTIIDGKVTSFVAVAAAGIGAAISVGAVFKAAGSATKAASKAAALGSTLDDTATVASKAAQVTSARFDIAGAVIDIATQWLIVAEKAIRHEIDPDSPAVSTTDWVTAAAATVVSGITIGLSAREIRKNTPDPSVPANAAQVNAGAQRPGRATGANGPDFRDASVGLTQLRQVGAGDAPPVTAGTRRAEASLSSAETELGGQRRVLGDRRAAGEADSARLRSRQRQLQRAERRLSSREAGLETRQTELDARNLELDAKTDQLTTAQAGVDRLNTQRQTQQRRVGTAERLVESRTRRLASAEADVEAQAARVNATRSKKAEVDAQLSKARSDNGNIDFNQTDALTAQSKQADVELNQQLQDLNAAENTLARRAGSVDEAQASVTRRQARLERTLSRLDDQQAIVRQFDAEVNSQQARVNRQQGRVQRQAVRVQNTETRVADLRGDVDRLTDVVDADIAAFARQDRIVLNRTQRVAQADADVTLARQRDIAAFAAGTELLPSVKDEVLDVLKGELIGRGVDIVVTGVTAIFDTSTAFSFFASSRRGAGDDPGAPGRSKIANSDLLRYNTSNRLFILSLPNTRTVNTGTPPRSFVGVPVPEATDPKEGFEQLAAFIGRDDPLLFET